MKLDSFRITSFNNEPILDLPLIWTANPSPYILKSADGLDIPDIVQSSYGTGLYGDTFYSMEAEDRVIKLKVEILPEVSTLTPEQMRNNIYKEISKSRSTSIYFDLMFEDEIVARIDGFISGIEPELFSPTSEVTITISCNGYLFKSLEYISDFDLNAFNGGTMDVNMSAGNAPVGFLMQVNIINPISYFGIREMQDPDTPAADFLLTTGFIAGDVLSISTEANNLAVYIERFNNSTGVWNMIHLADKIRIGSIWPKLFPRLNFFQILASTGAYDITSFAYRPTYWGL